jgi:hypothetical protein
MGMAGVLLAGGRLVGGRLVGGLLVGGLLVGGLLCMSMGRCMAFADGLLGVTILLILLLIHPATSGLLGIANELLAIAMGLLGIALGLASSTN